jgi:hypothetical protein
LQRDVAIGRADSPEPLALKIASNDGGNIGFVFDDENEGVVGHENRIKPNCGDCVETMGRFLDPLPRHLVPKSKPLQLHDFSTGPPPHADEGRVL